MMQIISQYTIPHEYYIHYQSKTEWDFHLTFKHATIPENEHNK